MNYPLGDAVAGLFGAFSIAAALADRNRHPPEAQRGTEIDLSATEALIRLLDPLPAEYQFTGQARAREGSRATYTAPSNVYQSQDGYWVTVVGTGNPIFERIAQALGQPELTQDPRFDNNLNRTRHRLALDALIADWCRARNMDDIVAQLERCQVPHSRVNSVADAMQHPHLQARQTFIDLPDPALGSVKAPCIVPRFKDVPPSLPTTGPARGQHNASFYGALGLNDDELQRLRDQGAI
jgi:crotonobetainyl-CoA:carnitine CoA-transferase CaiB-like acyl-CoA transferase